MATERQIYWQEIIDAQAASGLSKAEFFKHNNINPATYYYWFKKINAPKKANRNQILPVEITSQLQSSSHQTVDLLLPNGYQLSFDASLESTTIKKLLMALTS